MKSVHQEIVNKINALKPGAMVFPKEFRGIGADDAVNKALSRITKERLSAKVNAMLVNIYLRTTK